MTEYRRSLLRILPVFVAVIFCLWGIYGLSYGWTESLQQTVTTSPWQEMSLDLQSGGAVSIRGWDQNSVMVRVSQLDGNKKPPITLEPRVGGVLLQSQLASGQNAPVNYRFEIWVPRKYDLSINSAGGELLISDLEGNFRGKTRGGRILIDHSRGHAELFTGGGQVRLTDCDLSGSVITAKGIAEVSNVQGGVEVSSIARR